MSSLFHTGEKSVHEIHFHTHSSPKINQDAAGLALTKEGSVGGGGIGHKMFTNKVVEQCSYSMFIRSASLCPLYLLKSFLEVGYCSGNK